MCECMYVLYATRLLRARGVFWVASTEIKDRLFFGLRRGQRGGGRCSREGAPRKSPMPRPVLRVAHPMKSDYSFTPSCARPRLSRAAWKTSRMSLARTIGEN